MLIAEGQLVQAYQLLFLEVGKDPLEPEGELLSMYLMARVANPKQLQDALVKLRARNPGRYPLALSRGADGAAELAGPRAALELLRKAPGIDPTNPAAAPVLRSIVRFAHASKQPQVAEALVAKGIAAHPQSAVFYELRGLHLELGKAASDAVRAAYARAVELDPQNAGALSGLARLTLASDPAAALSFFDRAAAADPTDPAASLGAARALRAMKRPDEAERRLDALLFLRPVEAGAAAEQVALDLERNSVTQKTLERAKRAVRFGGGLPAMEQLASVHERLGQKEEAARIAQRVKLFKEQASGAGGAAAPAPETAPAPSPADKQASGG
jgi:tetratricopeptide (TPR) repeat protein